MRLLIIFLFLILYIKSVGQSAPVIDTTVKFHPVKSLSNFVDSIRTKVLSDTIKFNKNDIALTPKGFINKQSYSPLFFINILYKYKLDLVSGNYVLAFVNEMLVADKIESITSLEESKSLEIFGDYGKNGVIMIQLKDISKINLNVAGFKPIRTAGDNFH